jgi:Flp pilus assembly protein TadG
MQRVAKSQARSRRGAASAEFIFCLPLYFLLIFSLIELTRLGQASDLLSLAAREGCRIAVIRGNSQADAEAVVRQILNAGGITSYNTPQWTWGSGQSSLAGTHLGDAVTLTLSVPFRNISWLSRPLFLGSVTLRATATHCSETPT